MPIQGGSHLRGEGSGRGREEIDREGSHSRGHLCMQPGFRAHSLGSCAHSLGSMHTAWGQLHTVRGQLHTAWGLMHAVWGLGHAACSLSCTSIDTCNGGEAKRRVMINASLPE